MRHQSSLRRYVFGLTLVPVVLGFAALMAFASTRVLRAFFRPTDDTIAALLAPDAYRTSLDRDFDRERGWRPPADHAERRPNCVGDPIGLTFDGERQRIDPAAPERPIAIITVGDSVTHGDDADDPATYPALLAQLTGQCVANDGASGCGPAQAALRFENIRYAIWRPANQVLPECTAPLPTRPVGRPPNRPRVFHASFSYHAQSRRKPRRVMAKVEWHRGALYGRVGFIVTNLTHPNQRVVKVYNGRGTAERWTKEGKNTIRWTRLSCRTFKHDAVRLQLHALADNLANFIGTLAPAEPVEHWSLTTLREKVVKIGGKIVRHGRCAVCQLAEVAVPRGLFDKVLQSIDRLRAQLSLLAA